MRRFSEIKVLAKSTIDALLDRYGLVSAAGVRGAVRRVPLYRSASVATDCGAHGLPRPILRSRPNLPCVKLEQS